jgi:methylmalonyl-CoA/ethylmalonyl-CoA epimerase
VSGEATVPPSLEFHHVGYACGTLEADRIFFERLGYRQEGDEFADVIQGVRGCFMAGVGPRIELLENLPDRSTLTPWIDAGIKMYHLAYLVDRMDDALSWAQQSRARVVVSPVPAVAFGGRHIAFALFRNGQLLEFVERS